MPKKSRKESRSPLRDNIIRARVRAGMTQEELAEKSGVPRTTISHYERGARDPRVSNLLKIARALDTTIEMLVHP